MEENKINVQLNPGQDHLTITMLEGKAPVQLDAKAPIKTDIKGTIGAVKEYLEKRVSSGQFEQKDCHILVNRDKGTIQLVFNEKDAYNRGEVLGQLITNPKLDEFGINDADTVWTPASLGLFFKMNRTYFPDRSENMRLVSTLMNFTANVNSTIESSIAQNGSSADVFNQAVDSNLPESFKVKMPILKGGPDWEFDVETFAKISGKEVKFILISPDAAALLEEVKATAIDEQLKSIAEIAPDIEIIEV